MQCKLQQMRNTKCKSRLCVENSSVVRKFEYRIERTRFDSQPEGLGVAFCATSHGLGLIMYIFTTLEFSTHNLDFHLLTTSVNENIIINIPLYFTGITISLIYIYIYTELAPKLSATASACSSVVQHWSSN